MTGVQIHLGWHDWVTLFLHFVLLSLLSVGGAITVAPDMQRYLVLRQQWLTDGQFTASVAIAQAAPGPNVLFVALVGWNVGLNAAGVGGAVAGMLVSLVGILLPSTTLTFFAANWAHRNRELRAVRAFKQGMTPVVIALLLSTGFLLATGGRSEITQWPLWLLAIVSMLVVWRTRIHILWVLAVGAALGAAGLV